MTLNIDELMESHRLFKEAFTHKSLKDSAHFERLEFLGDSLIESYATITLFKKHPEESEGSLSRWRSSLVSQKILSKIARDLKLSEYILCKKDQKKHLITNERIQASLFESLIGAWYLVKGRKEMNAFLDEVFKPYTAHIDELFTKQDTKTILQEKAQKLYKITPKYVSSRVGGKSHAPEFLAQVKLNEKILTEAKAGSIKEAERMAAQKALLKIGDFKND